MLINSKERSEGKICLDKVTTGISLLGINSRFLNHNQSRLIQVRLIVSINSNPLLLFLSKVICKILCDNYFLPAQTKKSDYVLSYNITSMLTNFIVPSFSNQSNINKIHIIQNQHRSILGIIS